MHNPLLELSQQLSINVAAAAQSIVSVLAHRKSHASGLLIDSTHILTTDHTIEMEDEIRVVLPNHQVVAASLLGRDPGSDLALLQLAQALPSDIPPPSLVFAGDPHPGELVLAVSRSPETGPNASMGILSSVSGPFRTWRGGKLDLLITLDLALYPGSSGGVVLRADGSILGLATAGLSRSAALTIPATNLESFAQILLAQGHIPRGYLGVGLQPIAQPNGMIILSIEPDSPSAQANLFVGDVILTINGHPATDFTCVQEVLEPQNIGVEVPMRILRAGQEVDITIRIAARPDLRRVA
jgi:S1-C subfamily serine protease